MSGYSGAQIYQLMYANPATTQSLDAAQQTSHRLAVAHEELANALAQGQAALQEFWTGSGADAATGGLAPLIQASRDDADRLYKAKDSMYEQNRTFQETQGIAMKHRPSIVAAILCGSLAFAAGCGSGSGTVTNKPSTPASASNLPQAGAPSVDNPLKTDSIDNTPCNAATAEQVESIGGKLKNADTSPMLGKSMACHWVFEDGLGAISANTLPENTSGLSSLYSKQSKGQLTAFQPLPPIEGYPAVLFADGGRLGDGVCSMTAGLRNDLSYIVGVDLDPRNPHYSDPCDLATKLAGFAIQYLKGKQ
jgi:hypothetical protein